MYFGGLGYLFTKTPDEIWDFIDYLAQETWEYENAKDAFIHHIFDPFMMRTAPLDENQFAGYIL